MRPVAHQSGMALALLLWFLAALALLVAGLMGLSRQEVYAVRLQQAQAQAASLGDGVARMISQGLVSSDANSPRLQARIQVNEFIVQVRLVPGTSLVDILEADEAILAQVFARVGGLDSTRARSLASSVVQWRTADSEGRGNGLIVNVLEDIMAVPGLSRDIFDAIRWSVCADCNGGEVNLDDAPHQLQQAMDWKPIENIEPVPAGEPLSTSGDYRVDVRVLVGGGTVMQRSVWVVNGGELGRRYPAFKVSQLDFERDSFDQY